MKRKYAEPRPRVNFTLSEEALILLDENCNGNRSCFLNDLIIQILGEKNSFIKRIMKQLNEIQEECRLRNIDFQINFNKNDDGINYFGVKILEKKPKEIVEDNRVKNIVNS